MIGLLALALAGVLTVGGVQLYRYLVTDRISDGDGMVNEFANVFQDADTLKSIHWTQSGSSYDHGFCFDLEEADGAYTISGWCIDTGGSGEKVERTDAPLTAEQWAEIEQCLRDNWHQPPKVLPEGLSVLDGTESSLRITSQREGETLTAEYNGEHESALEGSCGSFSWAPPRSTLPRRIRSKRKQERPHLWNVKGDVYERLLRLLQLQQPPCL